MMTSRVCVVGLGYIGLPTAAVAASAGYKVLGVDVLSERVDEVNQGNCYIVEQGMPELLRTVVDEGRLRASKVPETSEFFVIAVPTPLGPSHQPDISFVEAAIDSIIPSLTPGCTVIIESTSPVGTTAAMSRRIRTQRPELFSCDTGDSPELVSSVIHLAYCPERVLPGRIIQELRENDRVVGGLSTSCADRAALFYEQFLTTGKIFKTNAETAELVKLTENAYRDVNIAFANEIGSIARANGVDPWDLITLANRHPRVEILRPGPGVGGHCIAVDPWFIVAKNPEISPLIRTAREVNTNKTHSVIKELESISRGKTIAILGLSYKPDIDDLRESPSVEIALSLARHSDINVLAVEPHIDSLTAELSEAGVTLSDLNRAIESADILVILVAHSAFKCLRSILVDKQIVDVCGLLRQTL